MLVKMILMETNILCIEVLHAQAALASYSCERALFVGSNGASQEHYWSPRNCAIYKTLKIQDLGK